jgi:hypothetical protein
VSVHQSMESMIEGMVGGGGGGGHGDPPAGEARSRMIRVEERDEGDGGGAAPSDFPPALTDAQGRYEVRNLPHAEYEVVAEAQAGKLRGRAANVKPDATVDLRAIGVTSLSGTARGPRGPAALFTLELDGPTHAQRTFTDGAFELGRVDPGTYTVRVRSSDGNADQQVVVVAGQPTTVDIALIANAIVVGTVIDKNGKPLANIPVVVVDDTGPGGGVKISLEGPPPVTGTDGRFRIEHKAGPSMVVVMMPRPVTKRGLTLQAGQTLDVGQVRADGAPPPP